MDLLKRMTELKQEGLKADDIADKLNHEGFKSPRGNKITRDYIYLCAKKLDAPKERKSKMVTLEVPSLSNSKVVLIVTEISTLSNLLQELMK